MKTTLRRLLTLLLSLTLIVSLGSLAWAEVPADFTGIREDENGDQYYCRDGVVQTGWIRADRSWTDASGNAHADWYYAGEDGRLLRGWQFINGAWYFFENGSYGSEAEPHFFYPLLYAGHAVEIGENWYYFHDDGTMACGGYETVSRSRSYPNGTVETWTDCFYAYPDGHLYVGWDIRNGKWAYFAPLLCRGLAYIGDEAYCFDDSGALYDEGYFTYDSQHMNGSGVLESYTIRACAGSDGRLQWLGWVQDVQDQWSYYAPYAVSGLYTPPGSSVPFLFDDEGYLMTGQPGWVLCAASDGPSHWVWLKDDGSCCTGWQQLGGLWYYFDASGYMVTGWQEIDGAWYYFGADGSMVHDTVIDGYTLDSNGVWVA